jgi:hypothetical protein
MSEFFFVDVLGRVCDSCQMSLVELVLSGQCSRSESLMLLGTLYCVLFFFLRISRDEFAVFSWMSLYESIVFGECPCLSPWITEDVFG